MNFHFLFQVKLLDLMEICHLKVEYFAILTHPLLWILKFKELKS